ncbi:MAG: Asp-tRNA(Asn)/Glu-tRNA(Gln) amidotransferase subunit GatB [Candidatus Binatia bacterium]
MQYEAVIGLEVHAQLLTASKIFCGCSTQFGAPPNANTCPVCIGMPGVLPVLNRRVVDFALRAALSTHCQIAPLSCWARKNYFYPDLPKGYQISMYELPIAEHGYVDINIEGHHQRIGLTRIHMEEDAGKTVHDPWSNSSFVDLNRAGVPLLEIVSEPDLRSPEEASTYLRNLRTILQYIEICDGNMEEGSLRCDANISIRPRGSIPFGTKVEVKNMNSFRAVEKAIQYEIQRQQEIVKSGGHIIQETRLWDTAHEITRSMRSKESAHDYRYFPDPDLLPLNIDQEWIDAVKQTLPELPKARRERFISVYGLPLYDAEVLTARRDIADYYEAAVHSYPQAAKSISNWVMESVLRILKEEKADSGLKITAWPCPPEHLGLLIRLVDEGKISGKIAKTVFDIMRSSGKAPDTIVTEQGLAQVSDETTLQEQVRQVLAENPEKVAEYKAGREKLMAFFVGQIMKATQGKANPQLVNTLIKKMLSANT